jgi:PRTRC genetic system protein B
MVWWLPSRRREIHFNSADTTFNQEVSGKQVCHPPLVMMAEANRLTIFALHQSVRPHAKTLLYRAPYFNLYEAGNMCAGSVRLPSVVSAKDIPRWEAAFFGTNFTHSNLHGQKLTTHKGGHNGLWRDMLTAEKFPVKLLCEVKLMTLERLVNGA